MTSTQFAEMTGRTISDLNHIISSDFADEIDEGIITTTKDSRGCITDYHLPETESIMLAAKLDKSYLRKIAEFKLSPAEQLLRSAQRLVDKELDFNYKYS